MDKLLKGIPLPNSKKLYELVREYKKKYTEHHIAERAKADAEQNIPKEESTESPPFVRQMIHERATLASRIVTQYKKALELIDAKIKAEEDFVAREKDDTSESITEYSEVEEGSVEDSHALKQAHRALELAEKRYNEFYDKFGRAPIIYIPHWVYVIFAILIFVGEIPLNAIVFQIFGENQVMTWIMAFIIGLSVPLSAHFVGIKYREQPPGSISYGNIFKGTVALAVIIAALYGLSVMRQTYLGEFKDDLGLTDVLVDSSFLFFWLNIAVLGAAVMIAYLSHDPVPEYQRAETDYKDALKKVNKLEKWRIKKLKGSRMRKAKLMSKANSDFRDGVNRVSLLKGHYDMLLKEGQELEAQCVQGLNHDVEIYRQENLRARNGNGKPKCFEKELTFPLKLDSFEEKLAN